MTVLHDYEAETEEYGVLAAGVTLDPNDPADAAKLEAALLPTTKIKLLRTKNSWGGDRADRAFAPGFPGLPRLVDGLPRRFSEVVSGRDEPDERLLPGRAAGIAPAAHAPGVLTLRG